MIVSVHIANVGARSTLARLARPPKLGSVPGLRQVEVGITAPLSGSLRKSPDFGRVGVIGFWNDEAALDAFLTQDPRAAGLAEGFSARLAPLRAHGSWPGLDAEVPKTRTVVHDGPVVVLTLGRFRVSQAPRFFRASAKAEAAVAGAEGLIWATGLARPPFIATCSLWESADAACAYAYATDDDPHPNAIRAGNVKPFHKREAFIRFHPIAVSGALSGKNPLSAEAVARVQSREDR